MSASSSLASALFGQWQPTAWLSKDLGWLRAVDEHGRSDEREVVVEAE